MFRLAHLSDLHLGPLPKPSVGSLISKRIFGFINWHRSRKYHHTNDAWEPLLSHLHQQNVDHIAVTGDMVNIALPAEFTNALNVLRTIGLPDRVTLVPGNHDAYVDVPTDQGMGKWADYMTSSEAVARNTLQFPFVRRFDDVSLIGVSSACPTRPLSARGTVGEKQLRELGPVLRREEDVGQFRVILIHHPPFPDGTKPHKRLTDADQFQTLLRDIGAELVLYGHNHQSRLTWLDGPQSLIPVIGAPSASITAKAPYADRGGYGLIDIDASEQNGARVHLQRFGFDGTTVRALSPRLAVNGPDQGTIANLIHAAASQG
ncbi:MAG: metallophosphoesterase [Pseudomonadota bacterium]